MLQILTCRMDIAERYGTDAAILLHNIVYWTLKNKAEGKHFHEGRYWMQASLKGLAALYPLWSAPQIKRIIAKLRENGALLVGNFSEDRMVRTNWYAPSDEILALYEVDPIGRNRKMQETKSSEGGTKSENANKEEESKEEIPPIVPQGTDVLFDRAEITPPVVVPIVLQGTDVLFDRFWNAYPKKKGKESARRAWKKLGPDMALCRVMAKALDRQRQSGDWQREGGRFVPYPATWLNGRRWEDEEDKPFGDSDPYKDEGEDGI